MISFFVISINTTTRPNSLCVSESNDEGRVKQAKTLPPAPKIKGPNIDIPSTTKKQFGKPEPHTQMTSPEPTLSVRSPGPRHTLASFELECLKQALSPYSLKNIPEPSRCVQVMNHNDKMKIKEIQDQLP